MLCSGHALVVEVLVRDECALLVPDLGAAASFADWDWSGVPYQACRKHNVSSH